MAKRNKGAGFLDANLELLGFGNEKDALIQAVKELFENALDAILQYDAAANVVNESFKSRKICENMLRMSVIEDPTTNTIEIICSDTGTGIQCRDVSQLCCGVFATSKINFQGTTGKYGVGLKAAMLYAQQHVENSCMKVTTTVSSSQIMYIELLMDSKKEDSAVVRNMAYFTVGENHQRFSGTEVKLRLPNLSSDSDCQDAAHILAIYFQSLRYVLPSSVGFQVQFEIASIEFEIGTLAGDPVDRFIGDFECSDDDLVYAEKDGNGFTVSGMGLILPTHEDLRELCPASLTAVEICLLRFANHVPMLVCDDFFTCGITKAIANKRLWKQHRFQCEQVTMDTLSNSETVTHFRLAPQMAGTPNQLKDIRLQRLVLAVDVSATCESTVRYKTLRKSSLDSSYFDSVSEVMKSLVAELVDKRILQTPRVLNHSGLFNEYVPLIAQAVSGIVEKSEFDIEASKELVESITNQMQAILSGI